jgi:hypothetical protein
VFFFAGNNDEQGTRRVDYRTYLSGKPHQFTMGVSLLNIFTMRGQACSCLSELAFEHERNSSRIASYPAALQHLTVLLNPQVRNNQVYLCFPQQPFLIYFLPDLSLRGCRKMQQSASITWQPFPLLQAGSSYLAQAWSQHCRFSPDLKNLVASCV